jgi:hypothetical protein
VIRNPRSCEGEGGRVLLVLEAKTVRQPVAAWSVLCNFYQPAYHAISIISLKFEQRLLTLSLLMSYIYIYIYGAPCKTRNFNVVCIWTYVWQRWKPSLSICCTMFQHWINAESYPLAQLCVNTLLATKATLITGGIQFGTLMVNSTTLSIKFNSIESFMLMARNPGRGSNWPVRSLYCN